MLRLPRRRTDKGPIDIRQALPPVPPLATGGVTARAIEAVCEGRPVVISSGPGAGKSTTVVEVVTHLAARMDMSITICTPTRAQLTGLAHRLADSAIANETFVLGEDYKTPLEKRSSGSKLAPGEVGLRTLASATGKNRPQTDLIVFEECWQATWADVAIAANDISRILAIGDAGQIGPVVTCPVEVFKDMEQGPHLPAPCVISTWAETLRLHLPVTYRLGAMATDVIAPLYEFDFSSARPNRHLELNGEALCEIESLPILAPSSPYDIRGFDAVVRSVQRVMSAVYVTESSATPMTAEMVAVVVSHNAQEAGIIARLAAAGLPNVVVGTADRLQGGEWPAVIALDPMFGYREPTDHSMSSGRLCVMLSRHMAHLTWVHDPASEAVFSSTDEESLKHRVIRSALQSS